MTRPNPAIVDANVIILAGNVARAEVTFVPVSGTAVLANVTVRCCDARGSLLTPSAITDMGSQRFRVDCEIPDASRSEKFRFRWECSSPKIVYEQTFDVQASGVPSA